MIFLMESSLRILPIFDYSFMAFYNSASSMILEFEGSKGGASFWLAIISSAG